MEGGDDRAQERKPTSQKASDGTTGQSGVGGTESWGSESPTKKGTTMESEARTPPEGNNEVHAKDRTVDVGPGGKGWRGIDDVGLGQKNKPMGLG